MQWTTGTGTDQGVIERGADVDKDQGGGKDSATDDDSSRAARGSHDKNDRSGNGQPRTNAVRDGVGQNVAKIIARFHMSIIVRLEAFG